jgi:hypothetical protein
MQVSTFPDATTYPLEAEYFTLTFPEKVDTVLSFIE